MADILQENDLDGLLEAEGRPDSGEKGRIVFRLTTSNWISGERICQRKELRVMRSLSTNPGPTLDYLEEDIAGVGEFPIEDLHRHEDGLYLLVAHEHRDWETGIVDEVTFSLNPYEEDTKEVS